MSKSVFHSVSRAFLFLLGIGILVTIIPHDNPWRMTYVARMYLPFLAMDIRPLGLSWTFRLSELTIALSLLAGLTAPLVLLQSLRTALASLKSNKVALFSTILSLEFFFFSLVPVSNDIMHEAKSVILFLMLGSIAFMLIGIGATPLIRWSLTVNRWKTAVERSYDLLHQAIMESPVWLFVSVIFLLELILTGTISTYVFDRIPHVQDSVAQLFHARIYATGHLSVPSPPEPVSFNYLHMINNGQWYSQYPPGHPALLMLGVLAGVPWLVNPLLGSFTLVALYFLGKELYDERIGRLAALLGLLSPFLLFMSSEFMNHTGAMLFFVLFAIFFVRSLRTGQVFDGALAGLSLGWLIHIRPYSAAALALPLFLYGMYRFFKKPRAVLGATIAFLVVSLAAVGLLLWVNKTTNGDPFLFGFDVLYGKQVRPGFGHSAWGIPHSPLRGLLQTLNNLNGINKYLFELPIPSLTLVFALFITVTRNKWDYILILTFGCVVAAYFVYWFQDWCFGPRFLYEPAAALILLTARGFEQLPALLRNILGFSFSHKRIRMASVATLGMLFLIGFASNMPPLVKDYANSYWDINKDVVRAVEQQGITHAIIFTRTNYGAVLPENDPLLRGDLIYARDFGRDNLKVMQHFPGYKAFEAVGSDVHPFIPPEVNQPLRNTPLP